MVSGIMLVGYEISDSDDVQDQVTKQPHSDKQSEQEGCSTSKGKNSHYQKKFEHLKERRSQLKREHYSEQHKAINSSTTQPNKVKNSHDGCSKGKKSRKTSNQYDGVNMFMSSAFKVVSDQDPFCLKKSKLEKELDEAIETGDYELSEKLSDEIVKRNFATQVKGAIEARKYSEHKKRVDEKKKKRKKLKWTFDHKQRWETKGNM